MADLTKVVTPKNYDYRDFKEFSNFKNGKQYNSNNEMFLAVHKEDLTPTEYIAFKRFIKLAYNDVLALYGVVHAGLNYIVNQINKIDLQQTGISKSTVRRMLEKVKNFNIIQVIPCESESGKQRPNLYIFQRYGQAETPAPKVEPVGEIVSIYPPIEHPMENQEQVEPAPQQGKEINQLNTLNTSNTFYTNNQKYIKRTYRKPVKCFLHY